MNKYTLAKNQISTLLEEATKQGLKHPDVIEALVVQAIQESISLRGADDTRACLDYELSNIGSDGVHEIQRR
ncbi:MAG: hypothetical protein KUG75_02080 [Pseudomonadales bacterium]|nr:hypothetical protein [Pseudomonadales bacterium]